MSGPSTPLDDHSSESLDRIENEKIQKEITALAQEGKLDHVAIAGFDARVDTQLARISREAKNALADFEAGIALRKDSLKPRRFAIPLVLFCLAIAGLVIELGVGQYFIFAYANTYRDAMPWIVGMAMPLVGLLIYLSELSNPYLKLRYPTRAVRRLFIYPFLVVLGTVVTVTSPLGWAALTGWALGTNSTELEAKVLSLSEPSPRSRGCKQNARLLVRGNEATVCLDGRMAAPPKQGDSLSIIGRISALGVFIEELKPR